MTRVTQHSSKSLPLCCMKDTLSSVVIIIFSFDLIFKLLPNRFIDFYFLSKLLIFSPADGNFSLALHWVFFIIKEIKGIF